MTKWYAGLLGPSGGLNGSLSAPQETAESARERGRELMTKQTKAETRIGIFQLIEIGTHVAPPVEFKPTDEHRPLPHSTKNAIDTIDGVEKKPLGPKSTPLPPMEQQSAFPSKTLSGYGAASLQNNGVGAGNFTADH